MTGNLHSCSISSFHTIPQLSAETNSISSISIPYLMPFPAGARLCSADIFPGDTFFPALLDNVDSRFWLGGWVGFSWRIQTFSLTLNRCEEVSWYEWIHQKRRSRTRLAVLPVEIVKVCCFLAMIGFGGFCDVECTGVSVIEGRRGGDVVMFIARRWQIYR